VAQAFKLVPLVREIGTLFRKMIAKKYCFMQDFLARVDFSTR
jgi:hypothetical protein